MNKLNGLIIGGAALALSAVSLAGVPMAAAPDLLGGEVKPFSHGRPMHSGFGGSAPLISLALKHKRELNLSGDQINQLEQIRSDYQNQAAPLHQQVRDIDKQIAGLLQQTPADLVTVKSKIQEAEQFRSELRYLRVEALDNGKSVLSPEQRDQLKTLLRSKHEEFRGRRHRQAS